MIFSLETRGYNSPIMDLGLHFFPFYLFYFWIKPINYANYHKCVSTFAEDRHVRPETTVVKRG